MATRWFLVPKFKVRVLVGLLKLKLKVMARFKNLVFVDHPIGGGILAKYRFDNGKVLSVVAGAGLYSTPNSPLSEADEVASFEVMFDGEVEGWKSREDIDKIFEANEVL